ncbi:MAG: AbrB/MazE/SpoVT family DNA-binding domain-containing protein [Promethearchaeota archaeon]
MSTKIIRVNKKGMITIPVDIRKKYNLMEGAEISILDIDGQLSIIPIYESFSEVQKMLAPRQTMIDIQEKLHKEELLLENDDQ